MNFKAKSIQICGTGSGVGKSVIVSALCRIFLQDGYKVCPFKAQNMALNSFVTKEKGEIGRAQATQAQACHIEPSVDMNPILIKPTSDVGAQIILRGKPIGNMNALRYINYKSKLLNTVRKSFLKLANEYKIVVIEGAGSPAEINLREHDLVNMKMAKYANAPVILVADIDKGGVFAWVVGTYELLTDEEKKMLKGVIINKFRGDKRLLKGGITFLEKRIGVKVLGVIPYFRDIRIPEEDAVPLDSFSNKKTGNRKLKIDVIYLPHISNFTDFDALGREADVNLRYVKDPEELENSDLIIIPGTKNTVSDLKYLKSRGFAKKIAKIMDSSKLTCLLGICGGYQILGNKIYDKYSLESKLGEIEGLGFLPVETHLRKNKILTQIKTKKISGYEIHHGKTKITGKCLTFLDGAKSANARVFGTYIHGIFDNHDFRRDFLNKIRLAKKWPVSKENGILDPDKEFDKLAKLVRNNIDLKSLYKILNENNCSLERG